MFCFLIGARECYLWALGVCVSPFWVVSGLSAFVSCAWYVSLVSESSGECLCFCSVFWSVSPLLCFWWAGATWG